MVQAGLFEEMERNQILIGLQSELDSPKISIIYRSALLGWGGTLRIFAPPRGKAGAWTTGKPAALMDNDVTVSDRNCRTKVSGRILHGKAVPWWCFCSCGGRRHEDFGAKHPNPLRHGKDRSETSAAARRLIPYLSRNLVSHSERGKCA